MQRFVGAQTTSWSGPRSSRAASISPMRTPSSLTGPTALSCATFTSFAVEWPGPAQGLRLHDHPARPACPSAPRAKRINAIKQYSFARHRLQDRHARPGNPWRRQHPRDRASGHIFAIGFDLYCQLLKESIARMKGEKPKRLAPSHNETGFHGQRSRETFARIPPGYIHENPRSASRRTGTLPGISESPEVDDLRREFRDRVTANCRAKSGFPPPMRRGKDPRRGAHVDVCRNPGRQNQC